MRERVLGSLRTTRSKLLGKVDKRFLVALLIAIFLVSVSAQVGSLVQTNDTIPNSGSIKAMGLGVYLDSGCINKVTSINWGVLDPGSNINKTVYIRNEGNAVVKLLLATSNWNPTSASRYLTLKWDYASQSLSVAAVLQVKLTLAISASITGVTSFSFDINLVGTG